jgi:GNAT superfamily N-acetyltransferase
MSEGVLQLQPAHIPGAMRLNVQAGWNQTEQDWMRLLALAPEGCFGLQVDGTLVATTTAVCYGTRLSWIGMVLTDTAFRGRGYARRLMEHALNHVDNLGVECIKLDATDMGRPLYLKLGFEDECPIERWFRGGGPPAAHPETSPFHFNSGLDFEAFGADRSALLDRLAAIESASVDRAFAAGRPGASTAYFGPCVAPDVNQARTLLEWFLARHPGEPIYWDLMPDNLEACRLAGEFGFEPRRRLLRMVRSNSSFRSNPDYVFAIAGFEYG